MAEPVNISYRAAGPTISKFMKSEAFVRGIMGPFGSGKSTACIMEIARRSREQAIGTDGKRRTRWAIVRNTYPELKTTTIKSWHQWFPAEMGRWVESGPPSHTIDQGDMVMEIIFVALDRPDDVNKLLSMELTGAWINEAREVPKAIMDGLTGRVGRFPSKAMGGCSWSGIIMDTNPPDDEHWWYVLSEQDTSTEAGEQLVKSVRETEQEMQAAGMLKQGQKLFEFFRQPSGLSQHAENINNLPLGYYIRQKAGTSQEWIKIYIEGQYGFSMDGKPVWPDYKDHLHCQPCRYVPDWGLYVGIDFGRTPAAVFGQRHPMGGWRLLSEIVTEDMGAKNFARVLKAHILDHYREGRIISITGDPAGMAKSQTDEQTPYDILASEGVIAIPAETNDPIIRIDSVAEPLRRLVDGQPALLLDPSCRMLRKAMAGAYCLKRLNVSGEARYKEAPDKNKYSHVADALQYLMLGGGMGRALTIRPENAYMSSVTYANEY